MEQITGLKAVGGSAYLKSPPQVQSPPQSMGFIFREFRIFEKVLEVVQSVVNVDSIIQRPSHKVQKHQTNYPGSHLSNMSSCNPKTGSDGPPCYWIVFTEIFLVFRAYQNHFSLKKRLCYIL